MPAFACAGANDVLDIQMHEFVICDQISKRNLVPMAAARLNPRSVSAGGLSTQTHRVSCASLKVSVRGAANDRPKRRCIPLQDHESASALTAAFGRWWSARAGEGVTGRL